MRRSSVERAFGEVRFQARGERQNTPTIKKVFYGRARK